MVLPRYFYDQSAEICRRYSGGCELGSSDLLNSFATAGDCYDSCDPDSKLTVLCPMHVPRGLPLPICIITMGVKLKFPVPFVVLN